jgi:hypothetical protein
MPRVGAARDSCAWCAEALTVDFLLNVGIFLPLGFGARRAGLPGRWVIAAGSCLSLAIELLQLGVIPGRDASALDWIANSLGTALGVLLATRLAMLLRPTPATAKRLLVAAVGGWLLAAMIGGWAIRPAATDDLLWGQRVPDLEDYAPFEGELLSARVNGREIPSAPLPESDAVQALLRAGESRVDVIVRPGPPTRGLAVLVRVVDSHRREVLFLGQHHQDLAFKVRLHAAVARMKTPSFALARSVPIGRRPGSAERIPPVSISAAVKAGRVRLSVTDSAGTRTAEFVLSPTLTWSLFLPWEYWFGPNAPILTALWIAGCLVPIGYWASMAVDPAGPARERGLIVVALTLVVASIAVVSRTFGLPPTPLSHWFAAATSVGFGWAAAWRMRASVQPRGCALACPEAVP